MALCALLPLLALPVVAFQSPAPALPSLHINPAAVSVSGISSGADMAVQLQVAYSSLFAGAGIFAGQPYHCAVHRFTHEKLTHPNPSVPYCDNCPANTTIGYDHCKKTPGVIEVDPLVQYARSQAANKTIDSLDQLAKRRVFLYRGKEDGTYKKGTVNATANFFRTFMPESSVYFESSINSDHLVPGIDPYLCWWEEWSGPDNCTFDGAGAVLKWIHGSAALKLGRSNDTEALATALQPFDQRPYFPTGRDPLLDDEGKLFVPDDCKKQTSEDAGCGLHIFLHGCGVNPSYDVFSKYAGFNEWAVRNRIVVLYPKMSTRGKIKQEASGCFDGYGQTGHDYDLQSGSQMRTIQNMVLSLLGKNPNVWI